MNRYEDQLPVDEEWAEEHRGERWTFTLLLLLDDLIFTDGIDGMNEACDLATGAVLTDLVYKVAPHGPGKHNPDVVVIEATGTVEEN